MFDHNNLEEFEDALNYDIRDSSDTGVAFYSALARETGGPILEIACGTGRVTIPIARQGLAVTGLDIVPGMLELARSKSANLAVNWVEGDGRNFNLGEQFKLIFLTGNAFQAFLTRADQEALLRCVKAHLHEDGLFAFETRNPRWPTSLTASAKSSGDKKNTDTGLFALLETRDEELYWQTYTDVDGHEVRESNTQAYHHVTQILHWKHFHRWVEDGENRLKVTRIAVRFTFPQELEALLHYNEFTIVRQYGDWNLEALTAVSPSIISVCRQSA